MFYYNYLILHKKIAFLRFLQFLTILISKLAPNCFEDEYLRYRAISTESKWAFEA